MGRVCSGSSSALSDREGGTRSQFFSLMVGFSLSTIRSLELGIWFFLERVENEFNGMRFLFRDLKYNADDHYWFEVWPLISSFIAHSFFFLAFVLSSVLFLVFFCEQVVVLFYHVTFGFSNLL